MGKYMKGKQRKTEIKDKITLGISIASLIISITGSVIIPLITNAKNTQLTIQIQEMQSQYENSQKEQAAIPILRMTDYHSTPKQMKLYKPYREPQDKRNDSGAIAIESYFSIRNFSFENMSDNIAYINHIEYGGEAFELDNNELTTTQGEVITFSNDNLFVGAGFEPEFNIIVKSVYEKYYSYRCSISPDGKDKDIYCYSVTNISLPKEYNIDNEVYKNRYKHIKINLYPDHIIVG